MSYGPVTPTLRVVALSESLPFYEAVLGFVTKWRWSEASGFEASETATMACLESGEAVLFLSERSGAEAGEYFIELAFVDDVDTLAGQIGGRASIDGPADRPWGSREFTIRDPDDHVFRFSCPTDRTAAAVSPG